MAGYRSFAGYDLAAKKAVMVLCNTSFDNDDLGRHILEPKWPVASFNPPPTEIRVDPAILKTHVGDYALGSATVSMTMEGNRLYTQITGQPRLELFASKQNEFFLKVVDASVTFERDEAGKVTHIIMHQAGRDQKGVRK